MRKIREIYDKLNRKNIILIIGIVIVAFLMFIIIFAPILEPYDPLKMKMSDKFLPPSAAHWFGTDYMGRDILSRVIEGSRVSLTTAMIVVLISAFIGTMIGLVSGFAGGALDTVLMRIVDVMLSFPTIVFALAISNFLGTGQINLIIAICCVQWVRYARIARGEALVLKNAEYMEAARSIGTSNVQMLFKYFFPNVISRILIMVSLDIGSIILYCASLSFLGLGAQPPSPDWGAMISDGKAYIQYAPWIAIFPGVAIAVSALGFNMMGDGIRDLLDPRMRESVQSE